MKSAISHSICITALVLAVSCSPVHKTSCGITVKTGCSDKVRLEVVSDAIIRVSAVPSGVKFSKKPSLVVLERKGPGATFSSTIKDGAALLSTAALDVSVDLQSGAVCFMDKEGNVISCEDRREFSPIEVDGTKGLSVRQVFHSPADEAFYGLGQHQADEWNYKGLNEELYQYNTKISVPFVVSSKGYGILWDSYSFCRWGDLREYEDLGEVFTLYDKEGNEGHLTGTYTSRNWRTGEVVVNVREEPAINQEFLETPECKKVRNSPDFPLMGSDVIFEGSIEAKEDGKHNFRLYYAGYTKVFIDGKEIVPEIWRTAWNPNVRKFSYDFTAGQKSSIRIEWKPDGGTSYCGLRVLSPVDPEEQAKMSWWSEMQQQEDYYFIAGDRADEVISGYRTLTGKAQVMPKWSLGYWQSRERYTKQTEVTGILSEFRKRHVPVDNIVLDWQYWEDDKWGSHEFDASRFPDPVGMVDTLHQLGGRFMISVWPKFYVGTEHFEELDSNGWIYRVPVDQNVIDWLGYEQSFYDAYAPGARKLFWEQMRDHLYPLGVDAWWMDASEPNIHDCTDMDFRKAMSGPTALGPSTEYFNAYALVNADAIYNGQRGEDPDRRVFLLTRNGFSGLQRYSTASWSGDIGTRWEDMKAQISAGLNYSLSGIPFWGQDIGGFSVENRYSNAQRMYERRQEESEDLKEWRELNVRWHQWGVYAPLYRAHGQFPYREPWNIAPEGHPAYESILETDRLRYRLMPYIYTMAGRVHFDDYTIMRGLVMDFPDDPKALNIGDEYMFGDALLICPVYTYKARSREVYLPSGNGWYDIHDNFRYYEGGQTMNAAAPYEYSPVFAREGQIIPVGPSIEYTSQPQDGSLTVYVFAGKDASYSLYEDDGLSYGYERGECSWIPMGWDETSHSFTISDRKGGYKGMFDTRNIELRVVFADGTVKNESFVYDGKALSVTFSQGN